jgi:hypothetical protein
VNPKTAAWKSSSTNPPRSGATKNPGRKLPGFFFVSQVAGKMDCRAALAMTPLMSQGLANSDNYPTRAFGNSLW